MDNVTILATALQKRRQLAADQNPYLWSKQRTSKWNKPTRKWRQPRNRHHQLQQPEFYIFYRITGISQYYDSRSQTKIYFMPCLKFAGENTVYNLLEEPFSFFAYLDKVEAKADGWDLITVTVALCPRQKVTIIQPPKYNLEAEDILLRLALPTGARGYKSGISVHYQDSVFKQRFHSFRMLYHLSPKYDKRYGVIDQIWDYNDQTMPLDTSPEFDAFRESILS